MFIYCSCYTFLLSRLGFLLLAISGLAGTQTDRAATLQKSCQSPQWRETALSSRELYPGIKCFVL